MILATTYVLSFPEVVSASITSLASYSGANAFAVLQMTAIRSDSSSNSSAIDVIPFPLLSFLQICFTSLYSSPLAKPSYKPCFYT